MKRNFIKHIIIGFVVCSIGSCVFPLQTYAWVPNAYGRVVTANTKAPVVGVWVKWMDGLGNYRYEKTDETGYYYFSSWYDYWEYRDHTDRKKWLDVRIDTNLDGVNDSPYIAPIDPYEGSWPAFSDGSNDHTFSVAQPITLQGSFSTLFITYVGGVNTSGENEDIIFTPSGPVTYTVKGNIFMDTNANGVKDNGEVNYSGTPSVSASRGTVSVSPGGLYTISNVTAGPLTVSAGIPEGYSITSPRNGPPPTFQINVGPSCSVGGASGASCY